MHSSPWIRAPVCGQCDMAENKNGGFQGGMCYELDLLEANNVRLVALETMPVV